MYRALADQLSQKGAEEECSYQRLRAMAADYLTQNRAQMEPFLELEEGVDEQDGRLLLFLFFIGLTV